MHHLNLLRKIFRFYGWGLCFALIIMPISAWAAKLAFVIDDFGYRPIEENKVLALPTPVSIAILPNAPHAKEMALKAHQQGREILIHLPMAPLSKQPLERDTLRPEMSAEEIARIIRQAVNQVPYAVGLNNHMGSAMTSSLPGMINVMQALKQYQLYFLDSMTIGRSQSTQAASGTGIKVIKRNVFLDDDQNEAAVRQQFNRAINLARKQGYAIAIGHPHPATVRVLQQMIPTLPADITLVKASDLLNAVPQPSTRFHDATATPKVQQRPKTQPRKIGIALCALPSSQTSIGISDAMEVVSHSAKNSALVMQIQNLYQRINHHWQSVNTVQ